MVTGAQGDLEGLVVFPWQALCPELLWQVQSGYSLELWKHLGVTKDWEPRESRGGLFQGRSKAPAGMGIELEVSAEIQVRHKQHGRTWCPGGCPLVILPFRASQACGGDFQAPACVLLSGWSHIWLADDDSGHPDPRKSGPACCDCCRWQ